MSRREKRFGDLRPEERAAYIQKLIARLRQLEVQTPKPAPEVRDAHA